MTDSLAAFLQARLDEVEAAAVAAGGEGWKALGTGVYSVDALADDVPPIVTTGPEAGGSDEDAARAQHIALHNPARVLREVKAKRAIIDFTETPDGSFHKFTLLDPMALIYRDHPDFDPAWLEK